MIRFPTENRFLTLIRLRDEVVDDGALAAEVEPGGDAEVEVEPDGDGGVGV